jgi:glycosyltransferase involved in cell wall biosynthesis
VAKVVFVNRYFAPDQSATSRMVSDLAFRLVEQGLSVAVVTSRQLYENPQAGLAPLETCRGVVVHRVSTATRGRGSLAGRALDYASFHIAAARKLLQLLQPGDVVVAKTDPPLISIVVSAVARWRRAVLVNWLQDLFPEVAAALTPGLLPTWLQRALSVLRDRSLRRAAVNIVLSNGMRDRLLARGIQDGRLRVVPNWSDTDSIQPLKPADSESRRRLGITDQFVVGYSGNFGRAHEFQTLLGAARRLRTDSRFVFLMTGGGAKAGDLQQAVDRERLGNFIFQDFQPVEMLSDSLAAADIHLVSLLPAMEGLIVPSKLYGIFAAGRPAVFIGDPAGDIPATLRANSCGICIPIGNSELLAAELVGLCEAPQRVAAMGKAARRLALECYTSEHAVRDWLSLLAAVAPATVRRTEHTLEYAR